MMMCLFLDIQEPYRLFVLSTFPNSQVIKGSPRCILYLIIMVNY